MSERTITRLWEVPGERKIVVFSDRGREFDYPKTFRDRTIRVGAVIDNDDVAAYAEAIGEHMADQLAKREERKAKRRAARPTSGIITDVKHGEGRRNAGPRAFVYLDGAYAFAVHPEIAEREQLMPGVSLDEAEVKRLAHSTDVVKVTESIDRLLAYRPRGESELRKRLGEKGYDSELIEKALSARRGYGVMSDAELANWFVANRATRRGKTPIAVRGELMRLGVDREQIDAAERDAAGSRDDALETAVNKLARRLDPTDERSRKRFVDALLRRGFRYGDAKAALDRIGAADAELAEAALDE